MSLGTLKNIYLGMVIVLISVGLLLVFSSSGYVAAQKGAVFGFFNKHLIKVLLSLVFLLLGYFIPYEFYRSYSKLGMVFVILLLVGTLLFAPKIKGASRWIFMGGMQIQPSELAKIILVLHLSNMIVAKGEKMQSFQKGTLFGLIWIFITALLIFVQPNVSTAVIIVAVSFGLLYVGGSKFKHLASVSVPILLLGGTFAMIYSHSRQRIMMFVDALTTGSSNNYQVLQAKIALGNGGILGVGLGQSVQSNGFVPEAYGDFIFSILGEEFGFVGTVLILLAYLGLFYIGLQIAKQVKDRFGQLIVYGLTLLITFSAFVNTSVVVGLLPTTGITLPFISYGGSSLVFLCFSVGIVCNVAWQNFKTNESKEIEEVI